MTYPPSLADLMAKPLTIEFPSAWWGSRIRISGGTTRERRRGQEQLRLLLATTVSVRTVMAEFGSPASDSLGSLFYQDIPDDDSIAVALSRLVPRLSVEVLTVGPHETEDSDRGHLAQCFRGEIEASDDAADGDQDSFWAFLERWIGSSPRPPHGMQWTDAA